MILSVSRRTDIPAFYSDWFFEQLSQGFVLVPNPINPIKIAKIPLEPLKITNIETNLLGEKQVQTSGNVEGIVFWTKNPAPILEKIDKLKDYAFYFLYTLTGYPKEIESNLPSVEERIDSFKQLSKFCPVIWRYDPILFSKNIDLDWHIQNFEKLCQELKGYTTNCKISFVIESYKGCSKEVFAPSQKEKHELLAKMSEIAKANDIQLEACADGNDWQAYGIMPSKCIDGEIFENLLTEKYKDQDIKVKRKNGKIDGQRKHCGCMPAVDIGRYDTCFHGCTYCYARKSTQTTMLETPQGEIYDRKTILEFDYK